MQKGVNGRRNGLRIVITAHSMSLLDDFLWPLFGHRASRTEVPVGS